MGDGKNLKNDTLTKVKLKKINKLLSELLNKLIEG
jgi:hypothetical protein